MDQLLITVYLQTGSKKTEVSGIHGGHIKIKVNSPPVDGKANEALILFLSKFLDIPKSKIKIVSGEKSRIKKISIETLMNKTEIENKLMMK
ncbi:MAG: YggU family protein [Gammaproteobacteria bacterium CG_4_10_14_0_8_um_filter_38_16]|nr:MAG: YggU family protein [Gammaproteobacteria bacterium CG_4_10_14_0_8_um_filter_38_16]PJA02700.1 MAG: YggU family protein [Gammaproteobacteria bacterium CG_4_10_14_0_2_um_filter_38_22]PJB09626.1 MAG: YggU family protein [Gammaproteobacteria bacterium CG_4_9_14_3_um_filter_38_9]